MSNVTLTDNSIEQVSLLIASESEETILVSEETQQNLNVVNLSEDTSTMLIPVTAVQSDLITQTDCVVYVPLASKIAHGIVRIGTGLNITTSGLLSLDESFITIKEIAKNGELILPDENKRVNIILEKSDVGLNNVDNTSDLEKPISVATQRELNRIQALIKGAENAVSYPDYKTLVSEVNYFDKDVYLVGQSVYIGTLDVPDLWVYGIEDDYVEFVYTDDKTIDDLLIQNGTFQVGYYTFAALEFRKVNLKDYVSIAGDEIITGNKDFTGTLTLNNVQVATINNIPNEYLQDATIENGTLTIIKKTGDILTFEGGSSITVDSELSLISENPVQNKVLYNPVTFAESERLDSENIFTTTMESGNISDSTGIDEDSATRIRTAGYISVKPNTTYTFTRSIDEGAIGMRFYNASKTFSGAAVPISATGVTTVEFTTGSDIHYIRFIQETTDISATYTIIRGQIVHENDLLDYLPLSGGQMTGTITLATVGLKTSSTAGWMTDQYGNIKHQGTSTGDYLNIYANDGTSKLKYYYETGLMKFTTVPTVNDVNVALQNNYGYILQKYTVDASALDTSTWYPVTIDLSDNAYITTRIEIGVGFDTNSPSWSTHNKGKFAVYKVWEVAKSEWGVFPGIYRRIYASGYRWCDMDPVRGIGQLGNSSNEYVYVRGGGSYNFYISGVAKPVLRTESYTVSSQTIAPTTTAPDEIVQTVVTTDGVHTITGTLII